MRNDTLGESNITMAHFQRTDVKQCNDGKLGFVLK